LCFHALKYNAKDIYNLIKKTQKATYKLKQMLEATKKVSKLKDFSESDLKKKLVD